MIAVAFNFARRARAFTVIELCIGLVITALVLGAMAAFMTATGSAWTDSGAGRAASVAGWQGAQRMLSIIHGCQLSCAVVGGDLTGASSNTAAIVMWQNDNNVDGNIQLSEIEMISVDPAGDGTYTANLYTFQNGSDSTWDYSVLCNPSCIVTLKSLLTPSAILTGLSGAHFDALAGTLTTQRPLVEIALAMPVSGASQVVYASAAMRAPLPAPSN